VAATVTVARALVAATVTVARALVAATVTVARALVAAMAIVIAAVEATLDSAARWDPVALPALVVDQTLHVVKEALDNAHQSDAGKIDRRHPNVKRSFTFGCLVEEIFIFVYSERGNYVVRGDTERSSRRGFDMYEV